jgi:transcriptional regulator with XRE-family HTH domain
MLPPGQVILGLRERLGMSRQELARALDWSPATIARWEKGQVEPSRLAFKTILAFAEERGVRYRPKAPATGGLPAVRQPTPEPTRPLPAAAPRFVSVSAERPRWSAQATVRFSAAPEGGRGAHYGRRFAVVVATVCAVLLLGLPGRRHDSSVPEVRQWYTVRHRVPPRHEPRAPRRTNTEAAAPVATPAPAVARLDAVLLMGAERRATFRVDGRSVTVGVGEHVGRAEVLAIQGNGVTLRNPQSTSRTARLGDDVRVD